MTSCRNKFDKCAYKKELSQSMYPMLYLLDPNKYSTPINHRHTVGLFGGNDVSITRKNMVDLESDLMGITRINSLCPEKKYLPHCELCSVSTGPNKYKPSACAIVKSLKPLPEFTMIQNSPKIDHVDIPIKYPNHGKMVANQGVYPPQFNPTQYSY